MPETKKARAIGFNHVALEVGDIEEALSFYGRGMKLTHLSKNARALRELTDKGMTPG
jgi:lactoylglutathione lyase